MISHLFHPLQKGLERPQRMNNPFYYEPHPLALQAVDEVVAFLKGDTAQRFQPAKVDESFLRDISKGKMFGVLVVERKAESGEDNETGYLAGYSGQIAGRADWEGFVPAVFDYLQPDGYFKRQEAEIVGVSEEIHSLENSSEYSLATRRLDDVRKLAEREIADYKMVMQRSKNERNQRREALHDSENRTEEEEKIIRESQFQKAELRRIKKRWTGEIALAEDSLREIDERLKLLRQKRHAMSDSLQRWLFAQFMMLNARGESRSLLEIWKNELPPAGAGECCEPRLLQYCFRKGWHPLCMAMFWWGESPKEEVRHHLHFYPACNSKCKPVMGWMLRGLDVESNQLEDEKHQKLTIIYEDDSICVVNKPAGMLAVRGKSNRESVQSMMQERYPDAENPLIVHRLDMATSGLMVITKSMEAYRCLQQQFARREVRKRYVAVLSHEENRKKGEITLPLRPDLNDRPRQIVDFVHGKKAETTYEIIGNSCEAAGQTSQNDAETACETISKCCINLYPHTGRTHQLRVHCAHADGLNNPIKGDELYGKRADRLYLHAEELSFLHPVTHERVTFHAPCPF